MKMVHFTLNIILFLSITNLSYGQDLKKIDAKCQADDQFLYKSDLRGGRTGHADISFMFDNYKKTKMMDQELKDDHNEFEVKREALIDDIRKDRAKGLEATAKRESVLVYDKEMKNYLREKREKYLREIFEDMDEEIQKFGQEEGYKTIINDVCAKKGRDVSKKILNRLNQRRVFIEPYQKPNVENVPSRKNYDVPAPATFVPQKGIRSYDEDEPSPKAKMPE